MGREESLHRGSLAEIALNLFETKSRRIMQQKLDIFAGEYRAGTFSESRALAFISSYCALEDVLADLKRDVTKANNLSKEILNGNAPIPE